MGGRMSRCSAGRLILTGCVVGLGLSHSALARQCREGPQCTQARQDARPVLARIQSGRMSGIISGAAAQAFCAAALMADVRRAPASAAGWAPLECLRLTERAGVVKKVIAFLLNRWSNAHGSVSRDFAKGCARPSLSHAPVAVAMLVLGQMAGCRLRSKTLCAGGVGWATSLAGMLSIALRPGRRPAPGFDAGFRPLRHDRCAPRRSRTRQRFIPPMQPTLSRTAPHQPHRRSMVR